MALHLAQGSQGPVRLWADSEQGAKWQSVIQDPGPSRYHMTAAPIELYPRTLSSSFEGDGRSSRARGKQRRQLDYFRAVARDAGIDELETPAQGPSFRSRLVTLPYSPQAIVAREHTTLPTSDTLLVAWAGGPDGTDLYISSLSPRPRIGRVARRRGKRRRLEPSSEEEEGEVTDVEEDLVPSGELESVVNVLTFAPELIPAFSSGRPIVRITAAPVSPSPGAYSRHPGPWLIVQTQASTVLGSIKYNPTAVRKAGIARWTLHPMSVLDAPGFARPVSRASDQVASLPLDAAITDSTFHPEVRNSALLIDRRGGLYRWDFDLYDVSLYDPRRWRKSLRFCPLSAGTGDEEGFWRAAWASDGHQALLFERSAMWSVDTRTPDRRLCFETHRLARSSRRAVFTSALASPGDHPSCWASTTDAVLLFDLRNTSTPVYFSEHGRGEDLSLTLSAMQQADEGAQGVILSSGRSRMLQHFSGGVTAEERSARVGPSALFPTGLKPDDSPASPPHVFDPTDIGFKWQDWMSDVAGGSQRACCMLEQGPGGELVMSVLRQGERDSQGIDSGRGMPVHIARSARVSRIEVQTKERQEATHAAQAMVSAGPRFDLSALYEALFELPEAGPVAKAQRQLRTVTMALQATEEPLEGVFTAMDLLGASSSASSFGLDSLTAETLLASKELFDQLRALDMSLDCDAYPLDLARCLRRRFVPLLGVARPDTTEDEEDTRLVALERWPHVAHALATAYSAPATAGRPTKAAVGTKLAIQTASEQLALDLVLSAKAGAMNPIQCPAPAERRRERSQEAMDEDDEEEAGDAIPAEPFEANLSYEAQQIFAALRDLGLRPSLREPAAATGEPNQGEEEEDEARLQMPSIPPLHFSFFAPRPSVSRGRRNRITPGASLLLNSWTLGTAPSSFRPTNPYAAFDAESDFTSGTESDASSRSWLSASRTPAGSRTPMSSRGPSVAPVGQTHATRNPMAPPSIDAAGGPQLLQPPSIGAASSGGGFSASQPSSRSQWRGAVARAPSTRERFAQALAEGGSHSHSQQAQVQGGGEAQSQQAVAQTQVVPGAFASRRKAGAPATAGAKPKGKKRLGGF